MQKHNPAQLEMFSPEEYGSASGQKDKKNGLYPPDLRRYYKLMYVFTGLVILCLVSYSAGVEKGKRIAKAIVQTPVAAALPLPAIAPLPKVNPQPLTPAPEAARLTPKPSAAPTMEESFTIQVASISQKGNINNELSRLKKKGYQPFSLAKGKYTIICVGKYNVKEEAQNNLKKIKNHYPDSMIRRL